MLKQKKINDSFVSEVDSFHVFTVISNISINISV